jgi:hypothetical protein
MISQVLGASDLKRIYFVIVLARAFRAGLHVHDGTGLPATSFKAKADSR